MILISFPWKLSLAPLPLPSMVPVVLLSLASLATAQNSFPAFGIDHALAKLPPATVDTIKEAAAWMGMHSS